MCIEDFLLLIYFSESNVNEAPIDVTANDSNVNSTCDSFQLRFENLMTFYSSKVKQLVLENESLKEQVIEIEKRVNTLLQSI